MLNYFNWLLILSKNSIENMVNNNLLILTYISPDQLSYITEYFSESVSLKLAFSHSAFFTHFYQHLLFCCTKQSGDLPSTRNIRIKKATYYQLKEVECFKLSFFLFFLFLFLFCFLFFWSSFFTIYGFCIL